MNDAASSQELGLAPAAATDAATTQEEAQRADADVTDLLTAELDAAVAATAPQRTDSTDLLTAELDALLAMPAPETATPPAAKPPPAPQDAAAGDAEPLAGRGQWVAFSVANAYAAKQQGAMAAFARKAPEARDVRALMDGEAPWASETHPPKRATLLSIATAAEHPAVTSERIGERRGAIRVDLRLSPRAFAAADSQRGSANAPDAGSAPNP